MCCIVHRNALIFVPTKEIKAVGSGQMRVGSNNIAI